MNRDTTRKIDACLEGVITPDEFQSLQDELRNDPGALDHWCHQAELHGRLEWDLAPQSIPTQIRRPRLRVGRYVAAAAALLVLGLGSRLLIKPQSGGQIPPQVIAPPATDSPAPFGDTPVARLTSCKDARWSGTSPELGKWIAPGELELTGGTALITFDSGASVQLNGPSRLHPVSATRVLLESGEAVVHIPPQANGFVFETPTSEISRRMSRFQATVDEQGHTTLQIIDGQVQVAAKSGDLTTSVLEKNRKVSIDDKGSMLLLAAPNINRIPVTLPEYPDLLPQWFMHWGFETTDTAAGTFKETGLHEGYARPAHAQAHYAHPDGAVSLVPGRFGNAIRLNGQLAFLVTGFPGISGNSPRTVACWVKIDPETPDSLAYSILAWGSLSKEGGKKWQLSWNSGMDNSGTRGAIRTEVEGGYQVGSTDLRTGRWHHVVSVFTGGEGANTTGSLRHYVDGRLESTTATKPHAVNTLTNGRTSLPVTIGRRIEKEGIYRSFRGELDEIYIFPTALAPEQIDQLYRANQVPGLRR